MAISDCVLRISYHPMTVQLAHCWQFPIRLISINRESWEFWVISTKADLFLSGHLTERTLNIWHTSLARETILHLLRLCKRFSILSSFPYLSPVA